MMKILNVMSKREYTAEGGTVKTVWYRIGTLRESPSGWGYLKLFHLPNEEFYVVEPNKDGLEE